MPRRTAVVLSLCVTLIAIPGLLSAYMLWSGIYQINPAFDEWFRGAAPVLGGDWVVVGTMGDSPTTLPSEIRITRIDQTGAVQWDKHVTGGMASPNISRGVAASPDGGCVTVAEITVVGGFGGGDVLVTKWSSNGTVQWHRLIGTAVNDTRFYIVPAAGGGYIVSGLSWFDTYDLLHIVKLAEDGTWLWQKSFGDVDASVTSFGYSPLAATADGGCVYLGWRGSNFVVKLLANGTVQWMRQIDEDLPTPNHYYFYSVSQDPGGGYILVGEAEIDGLDRLWLLRLDGSGFIDWQKTMFVAERTLGYGAVGLDDGYLVTGMAAGNNWFVRTYLNGDIRWERSYEFAAGAALAANIVLGPGETFVGIGRDYRSRGGWFLRAPISSGIVGAGCFVSDTDCTVDSSIGNIVEFDSTTPVADGIMDIDYSPAVTVSNLTANRQIDCSEVNDEGFVMGDGFESGDFSGWSDVFE